MGLWEWLFGPVKRPVGEERSAAVVTTLGAAGITSNRKDRFPIDVVGESKFQKNIDQIVGGKTADGAALSVRAELRPDPRNAHDKDAVMVVISGLQVGFLSRTDARLWNEHLRHIGHPGASVKVDGFVSGGWRRKVGRSVEEGNFGVRLAV